MTLSVMHVPKNGKTLKCLTVVDEYTRECLAIDVAGSVNRQRTIVGRMAREIERQMTTLAVAIQQMLRESLSKARQIVMQTKHRKTQGTPKLYSWHAPETGKSTSEQERRLLKRRQSVEPIIGHLKSDHRMNRCHLKGSEGDAIHAVLSAAGYNIRWLLRMIRKKRASAFICP